MARSKHAAPSPSPSRQTPQPSRQTPSSSRQSAAHAFDMTRFRTRSVSQTWNKFVTRSITTGRDVQQTPELVEGILTPLARMGWQNLIPLPDRYYPTLVRHFYCNLKVTYLDESVDTFSKRVHLESLVNDVTIELDIDTLAHILDVPNVGHLLHFTTDSEISDHTPLSVILQHISRRRSTTGGVQRTDLKPELRLFHQFLNANVIPKKGHFEAVSPMQCFLLYCLQTSTELNLPHIILREMVYAFTSRNKSLPFGALLTKIFEHFDIALPDDGNRIAGPFTSFVVTRGSKRVARPVRDSEEDEETDADTEDDEASEEETSVPEAVADPPPPPPPYPEPPSYYQQPPPYYTAPPSYYQQPPPYYTEPPSYYQQPPPFWTDLMTRFDQLSVQQSTISDQLSSIAQHHTDLAQQVTDQFVGVHARLDTLQTDVAHLHDLYRSQFPPPDPPTQ